MNADNVIILNGRLTRDPEITTMNDGKSIAKFTLAVNRSFKDANGERQADFHNCVIFGNRAEAIGKYFKKGSAIGVMGELRDNNYEKDGITHYNKQVIVDQFSFRSSGDGQIGQISGTNNVQNTNQYNYAQPIPNTAQANFGANNTSAFDGTGNDINISDNDLPF